MHACNYSTKCIKMSRFLVAAALVALLSVGLHSFVFQCPELQRVRNSVVIITGSSSGIGEELAHQYGKLGAKLVLAARRKSELEKVADGARRQGAAEVIVIPTDFSNSQEVQTLIQQTVARFGAIDTLILNHAAFDDGMFMSFNTTDDMTKQLEFQFRVNVVGSAVATRAALPFLERTAGHIAVVSSGSAKIPAPFHPGYVTSKSAIHGLYDTLRAELNLVNSRVSIGILVLGMIRTAEIVAEGEKLASLAMPVPACAAEMICSIQARWQESYVPKWIAVQSLTKIHPAVQDWAMNRRVVDRHAVHVQPPVCSSGCDAVDDGWRLLQSLRNDMMLMTVPRHTPLRPPPTASHQISHTSSSHSSEFVSCVHNVAFPCSFYTFNVPRYVAKIEEEKLILESQRLQQQTE